MPSVGAHALPRLDVPGAPRLDAGLLPQRLLQHVGAGLVAAGDEAGAGSRRCASGRRPPSAAPLIFAGSSAGPMMTKSLYMTRRRLRILPSSTYFFSSAGAWASVTSASPARRQRQRLPGADRDRLHREPGLLLEHRHQHVEQPRILRAGGRREDHDVGLRERRAGRTCQQGNQQQPEPRDRSNHHGVPPWRWSGSAEQNVNMRSRAYKLVRAQSTRRAGAAAAR